MISFILK